MVSCSIEYGLADVAKVGDNLGDYHAYYLSSDMNSLEGAATFISDQRFSHPFFSNLFIPNLAEGAVFYSDQQFVSAGYEQQNGEITVNQAMVKFGSFIRRFQREKNGPAVYLDQLVRSRHTLRVDISDLRHPEYGLEDLAYALEEDPAKYLPILEAAARSELLATMSHDEANAAEDNAAEIQVILHKTGNNAARGFHLSMRDIKPEVYVSKLVIVPGIVTAASRPKHKATHIDVQCSTCKSVKTLICRPGVGGVAIPRTCAANAMSELPGQNCGPDPYQIMVHRARCIDQQSIKLQERPEDVPTGDLPRSMMAVLDRKLCGTISPGTRVTAVGILSIYTSKEGGKSRDKGGAVAIRQPYLRIVGFQEDVLNGDTARAPTFTPEEEAEFRDFANQPGAQDAIFARIAPQIFGSPDIKKAVACLLFGGSRKRMPDGTYRRGDVNVLLLGDPSTAKSQFLKFTSQTAPIAVYTSGKGSSAAGLTASVVRDSGSREFFLEGGAMVLADGGVVCIDEFDKMRPEDRVAIHEAMEQQTISIAKAGITTMLRSRTSVLAAANPPSGRYDDLKSAQDNIDLQSTILSRFDLIFIVRDERSMERDQLIARHVLNVHRNAGARQEPDEEDKREESFLKRFIEYARHKCSPRLTERASKLLASEYVELRAEARKAAAADGTDVPAVPVTVRQLEAVVRIAESLAKMALQLNATESHVRAALELFKSSTMDAVRSGLMEMAVFSEEQRAEIHRVEEQIKRRVAIGAYVAERKLVDELSRVGFPDSLIHKGLMFLQGSGDFEYRRERRLVHRLK